MAGTKLVILLLAVVIVTGCRQPAARPSVRQLPGGVTRGGTYRMNMVRGSPSSLDPVRINSKTGDDIALQVFDRLVTFDSTLRVVGELARSWTVSPDGRRYTFTVRSDVRFHDDPCFPQGRGRSMTARDVVWGLERSCDPTAGSLTFWAFTGRVVGADAFHAARRRGATDVHVTGIRATDDTTVVIDLLAPNATFLYALANGLGSVLAPEAVPYYGADVARHPVGTGPFRLALWEDDRRVVLVRNGHYWQFDCHGNRLPYLDTVSIAFIKDDHQQFTAFRSGDFDDCMGLPTEVQPLPLSSDGQPTGALRDYVLQRVPALCTWFVDMHCGRPPFDKADVRRAFAMATDRHRLVRYVLQGTPAGPADYGIVPPVLADYPSREVRGPAFDPAAARAALARAGYPDGRGLPPIVLTIYPEPRLKQTAEALQAMWRENLGVTVTLSMINFAQFLEAAESGRLAMWGTRWYGDYPDAETFLSLYNGALLPDDTLAPSYPNTTRFRDTVVTERLARGLASTDVAGRTSDYLAVDRRIAAEVPSIMLFYDRHERLLQPWVRDNRLDAMGRIVLRSVWMAAS